MYYFSKQAGRFKDYCVVWFDINLLIVCVQYFSSCGICTFISGFSQFWMDFKFKLIYNRLFQWKPRIKILTIECEKWPVNTGLQPALRRPHFPTPNCSAPTMLPAHLPQLQAYKLSQSPAEPVSSEPRRHRRHGHPPLTWPYSTFQLVLQTCSWCLPEI